MFNLPKSLAVVFILLDLFVVFAGVFNEFCAGSALIVALKAILLTFAIIAFLGLFLFCEEICVRG